MKFHLKVNCIIGDAPGEPGSEGGAVPGGDVGFGDGLGGPSPGFNNFKDDRSKIDTMIALNPPLAVVDLALRGMSSLFGRSLGFSDIAQGDPGGGYSGTGGGPTGFSKPSTLTQKALVRTPKHGTGMFSNLPEKMGAKKPDISIQPLPKRVGRQQTILTSRLADIPTNKPTLLGQ